MPRPRLLAPLLIALAGCSSGLQGDTFRGTGFAFKIGTPPGGWQRIAVSHAALAYRDPTREATIAVNGRCSVDGEDVPLEALTQHLFLRFTERQLVQQAILPFDRREAMRTILVAKLDGVPMKFDIWVLKKDGCVYDLFYMAPPDRFPSGSAEFEQFVRGFATLSTNAD